MGGLQVLILNSISKPYTALTITILGGHRRRVIRAVDDGIAVNDHKALFVICLHICNSSLA